MSRSALNWEAPVWIFRVKSAGIKTAGIKTAGIKTAGIKTAGIKTAGIKTAGIKMTATAERVPDRQFFPPGFRRRSQSVTKS